MEEFLFNESKDGYTVCIEYCPLNVEFFKCKNFHFRYALHHRTMEMGQWEFSLDQYDYNNWKEYKEALEKVFDVAYIFPVYMLDHSSITFSSRPFSNQWDSGQVGWAYLTQEDIPDICDEYNVEQISDIFARDVLEKELKYYTNYWNGQVFSMIISIQKDNESVLDGPYFDLEDPDIICDMESEGVPQEIIDKYKDFINN